MATVDKNIYSDVLDDIVKKYNNTYHSSIEMKPKDGRNDSFAEYKEESNQKNPKLKIGDHARISKFKNIFAEGCTLNWSEKSFFLKK